MNTDCDKIWGEMKTEKQDISGACVIVIRNYGTKLESETQTNRNRIKTK